MLVLSSRGFFNGWKLKQGSSYWKIGERPRVTRVPSGGKVCNFSLATSDTWKDSTTGERQERTSWHNIAQIYNNRLAEIAEQYLRKDPKFILKVNWKQENGRSVGNDRYTTEVVLKNFKGELTMLGGRSDELSNSSNQPNETQPYQSIEFDGSNQNNLGPDDLDDDPVLVLTNFRNSNF